jgi:TPR repeat protein
VNDLLLATEDEMTPPPDAPSEPTAEPTAEPTVESAPEPTVEPAPAIVPQLAPQPPVAPTPRPEYTPVATVVVAVVLVLAFIAEAVASMDTLTGLASPSVNALVALGGVSRDLVLSANEWWRLVAGPLLHGDLMHLVMNGVVLLFAGMVVESRLGHARWLVVYGVGATCGALASTFANPANIVSIGASGAVMAVLGTMFMLSFTEPDPATKASLLQNSLRFLVPSLLPVATTGGAVDLAAHFGGALGGVALGLVYSRESADRPLTVLSRGLALALSVFTVAGVVMTLREAPALGVEQQLWSVGAAQPWVARACKVGSTRACVVLGGALAAGKDLTQNAPEAVALLKGPCEQRDDSTACFFLGLALKHLDPSDTKGAITAYERSCAKDDASACFNLGLMLLNEPDVKPGRIADLFETGCRAIPRACASLAREVQQRDPDRALRSAKQGCQGEDGFSCWLAGVFLNEGVGALKDEAAARELHEKSCRLNDFNGCNSLGVFWLHGTGGPKSVQRAAAYFEKACKSKDPVSCTNWALTLREGQGVEKDEGRARELFVEACEGGNSTACNSAWFLTEELDRPRLQPMMDKACSQSAGAACRWLGVLATEAMGRPSDFEEASAHYRRGCELDDGLSCRWYALDLESGVGVPRDVAAAKKYQARACELGIEEACPR